MFSFRQRPGKTEILFNSDVILSFADEHITFRSFQMSNLKCRPGGPVELISQVPSTFYGGALLRCRVDCVVGSAHDITVRLTPTKIEKDLDQIVREVRQIEIKYDEIKGRFRYRFTAGAEFLRDVAGKEGLHVNPMPLWGKDKSVLVEFDDPLLSGGVGPQVPMTQDWTGLQEPWLAEDCFTTTWRKRYLTVAMNTVERSHQKIVFNRIVNGVQQFYNRHALKCAPRAPYYYQKTDGRYLRYTPLFDYPTGHHICEWGYDMHFYAYVPPAGRGKLFRRGQTLNFQYEIEEIEASEVPAEFLNASVAGLEPKERVLADLPIYEEPVCRFKDSTLDGPDAYGWEGTKNCAWNRTGGRGPDLGAIEIRNGKTASTSEWLFRHLGPSYGCNPIPPMSRFRVSGWVRADDPRKVKLTFTGIQFDGPAMYSRRVPIATTGTSRNVVRREGEWMLLEFVSKPTGPYTIVATVNFSYSGKGTATLSELGVARL